MNYKDYFQNIYLEAFDNALNFLTDPANKDKYYSDVIEDFINNGGKLLGAGIAGTALTHPDWNYVLKTFYTDSCYTKFARFVMKHPEVSTFPKLIGHPHKVIPSFKRHVAHDKMYVIRMEKLEQMTTSQHNYFINYISPAITRLRNDIVSKYPVREERLTILSMNNTNIYNVLKAVLMLYTSGCISDECQSDFHGGNFMIRPSTGETVIIDPSVANYGPGDDQMYRISKANRELSTYKIHGDKNNPPPTIISGDKPLDRKQRKLKYKKRGYQ